MKLKNENFDFGLSLSETLILKGVAISILLYNHLFFNVYTWNVSISIFLFLSGYGLSVSYKKICDKPILETLKFQTRRYIKFYANYWAIFLLFVPIGIFVFNRSLNIPYGSDDIKWLITDILGLNGLKSYNITWWFNQAIVVLYLLFPFLYFAIRKISFFFPVVWFFVWIFDFNIIPDSATFWSLHFCFGIFIALNIEKINSFFNRIHVFLLLGIFVLTIIGFGFLRHYAKITYFFDNYGNSCVYAALIAVNLTFIIITIIRIANCYLSVKIFKYQILHKIFVFLGKHSRNIYLIHTFIYLYFFQDFIHSIKFKPLIFIALLCISLAVSVIIEFIKKITQYKKLEKHLISKI